MTITRRTILKNFSILPLPLIFPMDQARSNVHSFSGISFYEIDDKLSSPFSSQSSLVLVNSKVTAFEGEGFYLYPNWGKPKVYRVIQGVSGKLNFFLPEIEKAVWQISATEGDELFSGSVLSIVPEISEKTISQIKTEGLPLQVPALPVVPDYKYYA